MPEFLEIESDFADFLDFPEVAFETFMDEEVFPDFLTVALDEEDAF